MEELSVYCVLTLMLSSAMSTSTSRSFPLSPFPSLRSCLLVSMSLPPDHPDPLPNPQQMDACQSTEAFIRFPFAIHSAPAKEQNIKQKAVDKKGKPNVQCWL